MEDQQQHASSSTGSSSTNASSSGSSTNVPKIYVGGLSREFTQQDLENHFTQFGEVTEVAFFKGPPAPKCPSKAFGFVSFASSTSVDSVFNSESHRINGAPIKVRKFRGGPQCLRKIFVDGIGDKTTETDLRNYFVKFGTVTNVEFPDRRRRQRKPFCFVNFDEEATVQRVCRQPKHKIGRKLCDVRMATAKQYGQSGVSTLRKGRRRTRGVDLRDLTEPLQRLALTETIYEEAGHLTE